MLSANQFTVELADNGYQISGPFGEESGVAIYGDPAEVEVEGDTYEATVNSKREGLEDVTEIYLRLKGESKVEETEFDLEEGEDEEEGEGEDDEPVTA